jgi:hypothetical protein
MRCQIKGILLYPISHKVRVYQTHVIIKLAKSYSNIQILDLVRTFGSKLKVFPISYMCFSQIVYFWYLSI